MDLVNACADRLASSYNARDLASYRDRLSKSGKSVEVVKKQTAIVIRIYSWAVENELVPSHIPQSLREVKIAKPALANGAKPSRRVSTVPQESIDRILADAIEPYRSIIAFQLHTGARPGEACGMLLSEIDRSSTPWKYRPTHHKTEHKGKTRSITIGPKGREAIAAHVEKAASKGGDSPIFPSRRNPLAPIDRCTYQTYLSRLAERLGIPHIHSNQFRHNAATRLRRSMSIEAARAVLGHTSLNTTEIYAERDADLASDAAERLG